ncbi:hypothetical protein [Streptomyces sp. NPDC054829]|nr:hypothetical protein SBE_006353 [Streptomyces sp. SBE_14.2]
MTYGRLGDVIATGLTDRLDVRERTVLERRARIKACAEEPSSLDPGGWWYAVPGATYEGLFDALGLHDRFPVTLYEGSDVEGLPWRRPALPTFITPELDGWRLIFGNLPDVVGIDWDDWMGAAERLSAACGEAQMFYEDSAAGSDVWVVAEKGTIRRRYAAESDPEWIGEPAENLESAAEACGHLSVDPTTLGPSTRVRGCGWLALTEPGIGHEGLPALVGLG